VAENGDELAGRDFHLQQNYPNPFNPTTAVSYQLSAVSNVRITIYDVLGREIASLLDEVKQPGTYSVTWNGAGYPSGMYFCRMVAGSYTSTVKMVLAK
jgi:flagellar hook assembly protein FlgD